MKKKILFIIPIILVIAVTTILISIRNYNQVGHVDNVKIIEPISALYTKEDFDKVFEYIKEDFKKTWGGCELTKISYWGDEGLPYYQERAKSLGKEEILVIETEYYANKALNIFGSTSSYLLEPGSYHKNMYLFVRNKGEDFDYVGGP